MIHRTLKPARHFELLLYEDVHSAAEARELNSDCILDATKLLSTGIKLRDVRDALENSLARWVSRPASSLTSYR
jgi:hypothetical protein